MPPEQSSMNLGGQMVQRFKASLGFAFAPESADGMLTHSSAPESALWTAFPKELNDDRKDGVAIGADGVRNPVRGRLPGARPNGGPLRTGLAGADRRRPG